VGERRGNQRSRLARVVAGSAVTLVMGLSAVSCGDDGDTGSGAVTDAPGATVAGGGDPANGEQLSRSSGCAGCHGQDFGGGAGPGWIGLAGSDVELADGTVVVADRAYLTRAIADPSAELVADYNLKMPANSLSDAEIADIVAFIETLDG
jgi:cytochrome c oxidase subunit 2